MIIDTDKLRLRIAQHELAEAAGIETSIEDTASSRAKARAELVASEARSEAREAAIAETERLVAQFCAK